MGMHARAEEQQPAAMLCSQFSALTCGEVARSEGPGDVHDAECDHLLVPVDLLVLYQRQAPPDGDPFLRAIDTGW